MATMKDISRRTGLGLATISKCLNGGNVRPQNKVAIEEAVKAFNYTVNQHARGLKTRRSMTVGAVIPELNNTFVTTIMCRVSDTLRKSGYALIIIGCRSDPDIEREAMHFLLEKRVDGIINMSVSSDGAQLKPMLDNAIPVVLIDRIIDGLQDAVSSVTIDNAGVSEQAVQQLIALGHKKIGIALGPKEIFTSRQRLMGYNRAFFKNGMTPDENMIINSDYNIKDGQEAVKTLVERGATAIFTTNYEITIGALMTINDMEISMPDELSMIGFDKMQLVEVYRPRLTIVAQPLDDIGEQAAELLLERMRDKKLPPRHIVLEAHIESGKSVGRRHDAS